MNYDSPERRARERVEFARRRDAAERAAAIAANGGRFGEEKCWASPANNWGRPVDTPSNTVWGRPRRKNPVVKDTLQVLHPQSKPSEQWDKRQAEERAQEDLWANLQNDLDVGIGDS